MFRAGGGGMMVLGILWHWYTVHSVKPQINSGSTTQREDIEQRRVPHCVIDILANQIANCQIACTLAAPTRAVGMWTVPITVKIGAAT